MKTSFVGERKQPQVILSQLNFHYLLHSCNSTVIMMFTVMISIFLMFAKNSSLFWEKRSEVRKDENKDHKRRRKIFPFPFYSSDKTVTQNLNVSVVRDFQESFFLEEGRRCQRRETWEIFFWKKRTKKENGNKIGKTYKESVVDVMLSTHWFLCTSSSRINILRREKYALFFLTFLLEDSISLSMVYHFLAFMIFHVCYDFLETSRYELKHETIASDQKGRWFRSTIISSMKKSHAR
jgi:hypothetical protein